MGKIEGEDRREMGWKEERIKEVLKKVEEREGDKRERGWNRECEVKKREVRRELRKWWRGVEGEERFKGLKREYKELCERRKKEENEKWEKQVKEARRECEVWRIVNRKRKEWKRVNEGISMEEWKEYFTRQLGGVEGRVIGKGGERRGGVDDEEEELEREEVRRAIRRIKNGKAAGRGMVFWKYGNTREKRWKIGCGNSATGFGRGRDGRRHGRRGR